MKKSKFFVMSLILTLILTMTLLGCSNGGTETSGEEGASEETYVLKVANAGAIGDDRDQALQEFAKIVDEKSNGKVKVEVYSGGTLGSWRDTIEGLEAGIVQIVIESIGTLEAYSDTASIDAYPFLYKDLDHYLKVIEGEVGRELMDVVAKEGGFVLMGPSHRGARIATTTKKIENVEDVAGLKIRAPGIQMYIKTWEYLGATPTPMDVSEIYTGIQQGTVEGQENPLMFSYGGAYYEVCDYLIMTNHVYSTDVFIFNDDYFNSLPEDVQVVLRESAEEAARFRTQLVIEQEEEIIEKFKEKGVEVVYPELEGFYKKLEDFSQEFPHLKEWVEKIQAVQ